MAGIEAGASVVLPAGGGYAAIPFATALAQVYTTPDNALRAHITSSITAMRASPATMAAALMYVSNRGPRACSSDAMGRAPFRRLSKVAAPRLVAAGQPAPHRARLARPAARSLAALAASSLAGGCWGASLVRRRRVGTGNLFSMPAKVAHCLHAPAALLADRTWPARRPSLSHRSAG